MSISQINLNSKHDFSNNNFQGMKDKFFHLYMLSNLFQNLDNFYMSHLLINILEKCNPDIKYLKHKKYK